MDNYQQIYLELAYLVENNQFEKAKAFVSSKPIPEVNFLDLKYYMENEPFDKLIFVMNKFSSHCINTGDLFYPVMESVIHNRIDIFDYFINDNPYHDDLISAFVYACGHNNNYCIQRLIEKNVLGYCSKENPIFINYLLLHENFEMIDLILNSCDAVSIINFERALLEYDSSDKNISEKSYRYVSSYVNPESLFVEAISKNNIAIVQYLINDGFDVSYDNDVALNICAKNGYVSMMELLISHGAGKYDHKEIALSYAVFHPHLNIIQYLLDLDVNYQVALKKADKETREWMETYINSKTMAHLFDQELPLKEEDFSKTKL